MNTATPIPDSITRTPSGSIEYGSCGKCGAKIHRSMSIEYDLPWVHAGVGRTRCAEGKTK